MWVTMVSRTGTGFVHVLKIGYVGGSFNSLNIVLSFFFSFYGQFEQFSNRERKNTSLVNLMGKENRPKVTKDRIKRKQR